MEWVETTGRTIEEAKDAALDQLGVDEQDAEFEVLEEPRSGLFGRLRAQARVRARVRPTRPRPKLDRRERRRRTKGGGGGSRNESGPDADGPSRESQTVGAERAGRSPSGEARSSRSRSRRRSPSAGSSPDRAPATERTSDQGAEMIEELSLEEQSDIVRSFVEGLVESFGLTASTSVEVVDDTDIEVRVEGDDLGLMIGPRGHTLAAVQELARTVVQRHGIGARHGRVHIDVAGYRQRRREALERFTRQVAEQVRSSGRPTALEPMGASDRKIVHDTVNDLDGLATTSEGEEPRRRVVILPVGD